MTLKVESSNSVSDNLEEAALIAKLRYGDESAWKALVEKYASRLLATARRILRDEQEAEDVVQEAFLVGWRDIERFRRESRLYTWLHSIVVKVSLMRLRSRSQKNEVSIESLLPRFTENGLHEHHQIHWCDPGDELRRKELRQIVLRCLDKIPETYRLVVVLRDIEELEADEAAELLGVSKNTLKVRLHRARQALKTVLERELSDD